MKRYLNLVVVIISVMLNSTGCTDDKQENCVVEQSTLFETLLPTNLVSIENGIATFTFSQVIDNVCIYNQITTTVGVYEKSGSQVFLVNGKIKYNDKTEVFSLTENNYNLHWIGTRIFDIQDGFLKNPGSYTLSIYISFPVANGDDVMQKYSEYIEGVYTTNMIYRPD